MSEKEKNNNESNKNRNETVVTELHFDLFKQYAWLSSALIGAIILLLQSGSLNLNIQTYTALALLGASIYLSLSGQDHIVNSLLKGRDIYSASKRLKLFRFLSLLALGAGIGIFAMEFFNS